MQDPEGSSADSSVKAYAYSSNPSPVRGPETVVHPTRQPGAAPDDPAARLESSTWKRLFPTESDTESPADSDAATGCELEHFVIEERIGVGGMGAVFRAQDRRLDRVVALKVLSPTQAQYEGTLQRFQNEARAAARLDHDNIARVYYIGEDRDLQFIAYEFVTGTNIRDLIRDRGRLDPAQAVNYTLQIATALNHTFAAGVVHRDIKPSNIIISPNGRAKLVDLGLARKQLTAESQELTTAGTTLGTFDYIAPEQAKDPRSVDVRSDIYSLGCTLYHMLVGSPPYPDGTMLQKLLDHQGKSTPDPAAVNPKVSPELSAICRKMMAADPDRRYENPDELMRDLAVVAASLGLRGVNPEGLIWTPSRIAQRPVWERHAGLIATTAILFLVVLGLTFFPDIRQRTKGLPVVDSSATPNEDILREPAAEVNTIGEETTNGDSVGATTPAAIPEPGSTEPFSEGSSNETAVAKADDPEAARTRRPLTSTPFEPLTRKNIVPTLSQLLNRQPVEAKRPESIDEPRVATARPTTTGRRRNSDDTSESAGTLPFQVPVDEPPQIAIVSKDAGEPRAYETLEAACADAPDNSIIELRFNGSRGRTERPLVVSNKKVTIRGAKGFRPLVEFESLAFPDQPTLTRMISINGGSVELNNLDILLNVSDEIDTDLWALFSVVGSDEVRIKRTTVSIANASGRPATVFELTDGLGRAIDMDIMDETQPAADAEFHLTESIVRGGGSLVQVRNSRPFRVEITQALVAVEQALLEVGSDRERSLDNADLELRIEHATCVLGGNLLQLTGDNEPGSLVPVRIIARSNLFTSPDAAPLVAMSGDLEVGDFRQLLSWSGFDNFFENFVTFWRVEPARSLAGTSNFPYDAWKNYWGSASTGGGVGTTFFRRGRPEKPLVALEPSDVALIRNPSTNPAVDAAPDGTDAGVDHARLPTPSPYLELP